MGILRVDHPDILEFIQCKADTSEITNFNISVGLTESFMEAVSADENYDLINPRTNQVAGQLNAREVFALIVEMAWKNGEPGIVFLDRINRANPTPQIGEIEATNPCGEQPLLPNESCNLGSINLAKMAQKEDDTWVINWERLGEVVEIGVRFLDNVIDCNRYPIPAIEEMTLANRKIGLGVMGFADLLIRLGIPYNSEEGVELGRSIMKFIQEKGHATSMKLGEERGSFPNYQGSIFAKTNKPMRNATVTTIAPTGTISIMAGCSSGVEPIFALAFTRNVMDDDRLIEVNEPFQAILQETGYYSEELIEKVAKAGNVKDVTELPEALRDVFVTAYEVSPEWHIKMQAAFQEYTDNAVSKTVNFPQEATREDIQRVYQLAYDLNCKGVTVYRSGSREGEVLTVGHKEAEKQATVEQVKAPPAPRKRPMVTTGQTIRIKTGCGSLYVTINEDEQGICEVFTTIGKAGGCAGAFSEATARLISLSLRSGVEVQQVIRQLKGIRCPHPIWQDGKQILSCPDAIAQVLELYLKQNSDHETSPQVSSLSLEARVEHDDFMPTYFSSEVCPDCGSNMIEESGCATCVECGFSRCS